MTEGDLLLLEELLAEEFGVRNGDTPLAQLERESAAVRLLAELVADEIGLRGGDTPLALLEREAAALIALGSGDLVDAMRRADDFGAAVKAELARSWRFCRCVRAEAERVPCHDGSE